MAVRATDSSVAACAVLGSMAWSSAVSVTGTLAGEARCSGVPWAKAKPVIAPPVPRLTSAVACCHHGLRGGCTDSPTSEVGSAERPPRWRRPLLVGRSESGLGQVLQNGLDLLGPRVARVLVQHLGRVRLLGGGPDGPLLVDVGHQRAFLLPGLDRLGADAGEAGP